MKTNRKMIRVCVCCAIFLLLSGAALTAKDEVVLKREPLTIPTYEIEKADLNPLYFTGRVYQGAQGHVYPYALYDILTDRKVNRSYDTLYLENQYLRIGVLPELGGRILEALDKTDNFDFFYRQHVVKPALIGMLGAWISGGVEWNIPHHHRPSTYMPIDWTTSVDKNGGKTIWVGETELRHRLKWSVGLTVRPENSVLEAHIKIMNRSPYIQSMLCWANVSVHCDENYQVIFPPTTQHGTGHSKVDFVDWPINKGIDYSWWKNHTDQFRSVFAWDFKEDFLAGYDHAKQAGTVHYANHHIVGGKKFFLWGNHDRAKMWDQMLTDEDGCYLELMVGAWSDNQPDYSWIAPGEVRDFKQYWYPISGIKHVKSANLNGAVNLDRTAKDQVFIGFCPTKPYKNAKAVLTASGKTISADRFETAPGKPYTAVKSIDPAIKDQDLRVEFLSESGELLGSYNPPVLTPEPEPKPVEPTVAPSEYKTNEELYLAAMRIEQFHNAQLDPMPYYEEVLRRDPADARVNTALGIRFSRQGKWELAQKHLETAIKRLGHNYTVLRDGEPHYYLGEVYRNLKETQKAKDQYWKAIWTMNYQSAAYFALARIAAEEKNYSEGLHLIDESLNTNGRNTKALLLKAYLLRKTGEKETAAAVLNDILAKDPLDYQALAEKSFLEKGNASFLKNAEKTRGGDLIRLQEMLEMAVDYSNFGAYDESNALLKSAIALGKPYANSPMPYYYIGWNLLKKNPKDIRSASAYFKSGSSRSSDYCFPFRLEEIDLFETVIKLFPKDSSAHYYFGNLLYYLEQKDRGIAQWEAAVQFKPDLGRAWRNIGFAYDRKNDLKKAVAAYEKSLSCDKSDPRVFTELDIIYAKLFKPAQERLDLMEKSLPVILKHDDAVIRLVGLYNETGNCEKAIEIFKTRHFHVWEGGRAVHNIFVDSHLIRGLQNRNEKKFDAAVKDFEDAQTYPANLEVGRTIGGGQNAKVFYFLGTAYDAMGDKEKAKSAYEKSVNKENEPETLVSELTFFRIMSLKKLGKKAEAQDLLDQFKAAVKKEMETKKKIDEFSKFGEEGTAIERLARLNYYVGLAAFAEGKKDQMNQSIDEALKLNPNLIWPKLIRNE
ncbi:MAG: DUF5107 domain-containing protein [Planctomycetia bacterium]|nr:DUF5107 domain-containing protein [Planctomycetia bacterium]